MRCPSHYVAHLPQRGSTGNTKDREAKTRSCTRLLGVKPLKAATKTSYIEIDDDDDDDDDQDHAK